ncbi:MAG: hypothetical protein LBJ75_01290, partial [Puniceicoccales bacterium]|nr:hypothetical protein [Puniceicoccales bacterium]
LLDQNLPIVMVYILTMATREQETTESLVSAIQAQQKRSKADRQELIIQKEDQLIKQQELAKEDSEASWKGRVNVDRTGAVRKDDKSDGNCAQAVLAIMLFVMMPGIAIILIIVCSIITQIVQAATESHAKMRQFERVMAWINPADAFTEGMVAIVCELGGYDPDDERMQKLKMGLKITAQIIAAIGIIVAGIALTVVTGGGGAPAAAMAIAGALAAIVQLVCAVLEYKQAEKELNLAQSRFVLNKLLALVEQMKMNLEVVSQDIDALIEMFSSSMSNVREQYEKASRILKEYNDTKQMIAQNIRS